MANAAGILVISKDHIQIWALDNPRGAETLPPAGLVVATFCYCFQLSENLTLILFHYDGRTSEWSEFEWSKRAIHITAHKQSKWWYAKRFLHPYIMAPYDYIFIWDEDLGLDDFEAEKYIELMKKHGANYVIYKLIGAGPARLAAAIQLLAFGFNCGFE
ncbi:hypothetical protein Tco_1336720, partial [Tanacetum coccineum]